jgi:hypothetical protein
MQKAAQKVAEENEELRSKLRSIIEEGRNPNCCCELLKSQKPEESQDSPQQLPQISSDLQPAGALHLDGQSFLPADHIDNPRGTWALTGEDVQGSQWNGVSRGTATFQDSRYSLGVSTPPDVFAGPLNLPALVMFPSTQSFHY